MSNLQVEETVVVTREKEFDEEKSLISQLTNKFTTEVVIIISPHTSHRNSFHLYRLMTPDDTIS